MNTTKLGLDWWHKLPFTSDNKISKTDYCLKYYKHNNYYYLKDEEIENIFYNEVIVKWWDSSDKLSLMQKYPHYNTDEMYLKEHYKEELEVDEVKYKELLDSHNELLELIKSDSVYNLLRRGVKSPSSTGMDDCNDSKYFDLYNISTQLRNQQS